MTGFVTIPGGSVTLKDARRGEERTVELLPFEISTTTVTVTEFVAGRVLPESSGLPATGLRWLDAVVWCNTASETAVLDPAYLLDGTASACSTCSAMSGSGAGIGSTRPATATTGC